MRWWLTVFPGLFILLAVLGVNFMGDGLRDAIDPRLVSGSQAPAATGAADAPGGGTGVGDAQPANVKGGAV